MISDVFPKAVVDAYFTPETIIKLANCLDGLASPEALGCSV
jgi:hypothetical protein